MAGPTEAGQQTARTIRLEAANLIVAHGYEATSLRQVADAVGIKVGSLYNHISSKEDLLNQLLGGTMDDLLGELSAALDQHTDVVDRLIAMLRVHIRFHAERAQSVFIGNSELRSLNEAHRVEIVTKRREYRETIEQLIRDAAREKRAEVLDARLHAFSIVAQGTHIAAWYRPAGALSLDYITGVYSKMALRELGLPDADALVDSSVPTPA